jgi:hypothetical protein
VCLLVKRVVRVKQADHHIDVEQGAQQLNPFFIN